MKRKISHFITQLNLYPSSYKHVASTKGMSAAISAEEWLDLVKWGTK